MRKKEKIEAIFHPQFNYGSQNKNGRKKMSFSNHRIFVKLHWIIEKKNNKVFGKLANHQLHQKITKNHLYDFYSGSSTIPQEYLHIF